MHPLVGQRQDDALVDILREVHLVLPGHEPQHFAVVFVLLLGEADHEPPLEIDRNAAVLQTAVARDDDMARDPDVESEQRLRTLQPHGHLAGAVPDLGVPEGIEERLPDFEPEIVMPVLQPPEGYGISLSHLHLCTFSAQSY